MKYLPLLSSLLSTIIPLASSRPAPGTWNPAIITTCDTTSRSPDFAAVQALAAHYKNMKFTCSHNFDDDGAGCELMFQNDKASVSFCAPVGRLFACTATYIAITTVLDMDGCAKTYGGVKRVSGKVVLPWGLGTMVVSSPKAVREHTSPATDALVLDTSAPP